MTLFFNGKKMVNIKHVKSTVFYNTEYISAKHRNKTLYGKTVESKI